MARKPAKRGAEITATEAQNARPSDILAGELESIFEDAQQWLDGTAIADEAQAAGIEILLKLTREKEAEIEAARKAERQPYDEAVKEIQQRYKPLTDRTELVKKSCLLLLTAWRGVLAKRQADAAEEVRRAAAEASEKAQRAAAAAGNNLAAQEIVKIAEDEARRLDKAAERTAKKVGVGLRTRTVHDIEITDIKAAIGAYYRAYPDEITNWIEDRLRSKVASGVREFPGVTITPRKEAY
jgi:hypothetical protein